MPSIRSVTEILDISESKNTPNRMAYKYIIKQVDELLRTRATDQQYDAMFEVPAMIMYQPNYERDFVTNKIVKHYEKIGFKCDIEVYQVTIKWGKFAHSDSESDSESETEEFKSGLYGGKLQESSDEEEKLPTRSIVVDGTGPSLAERVSSMKKGSKKTVTKKKVTK